MSLRPLEDGPAGRSRRRWFSAGRSDAAPDAADVYRALAPAVLGYLRSQRAAEPEDLLGEVFLQVVRDLPRFRGDDDDLRRWVFTIAYHRLVDARRRSGRRPAFDDGPIPELRSAPPADLLDPDLVRALCELTAEQREVVALRFVADLSDRRGRHPDGPFPRRREGAPAPGAGLPGRTPRRRRHPADRGRHRLISSAA